MDAVSLPFADLNSARLRYMDKGSGPTLLLIHGLGATHADWQKQIDFFARVFRVIAPDLRGHGDSEGEGPFNVDRLATDLSLLMDMLKIGSFFVIGHSMGGAVAMQLALFKPERVKKLVLADTLPSFVPNTFRKRLLLWTRLFIMRFMGPEALAKRTAKQMFPKKDQESLRELLILQNNRTPKPVYLALLRALSKWTVVDRLSWLNMPTFVIAGEIDYFPPEEAQSFADSLPDGRCRIIQGARHHLPLERPEDFNRVTMDFLMPGSHIASTKGDAGLNWLRIDTAAQKKIDVQALLKKPK
ncbi:MAG: alpha/beta hydrolase [Pseudomonadota bacterium]